MKKTDPIIVALVGVLACLGTWTVTTQYWLRELRIVKPFYEVPLAEARPYANKYGLQRSSQSLEELFIRDFYQDRRGGVFLDVGANHFMANSNTYYLETQLGWSGVAVEALGEFAEGYRLNRPRTTFVAMFASDTRGRSVSLFVPPNSSVTSSISQEFTVRNGTPGVARSVLTTTLTAALEQAGIEQLDFMSMDIELAEPQALKGFDINRFQPTLVCIEAHPEVRQRIIDYFQVHGYRVVGRYLRADARNLYFTNQPVTDDPAMMGHRAH